MQNLYASLFHVAVIPANPALKLAHALWKLEFSSGNVVRWVKGTSGRINSHNSWSMVTFHCFPIILLSTEWIWIRTFPAGANRFVVPNDGSKLVQGFRKQHRSEQSYCGLDVLSITGTLSLASFDRKLAFSRSLLCISTGIPRTPPYITVRFRDLRSLAYALETFREMWITVLYCFISFIFLWKVYFSVAGWWTIGHDNPRSSLQ